LVKKFHLAHVVGIQVKPIGLVGHILSLAREAASVPVTATSYSLSRRAAAKLADD
jgi:hypothetical protein